MCNIRDPASIAALVDFIRSSGLVGAPLSLSPPPAARIDYLVNNAGGQFPSLAADMSAKGWSAVIDTNLTGTFLLSQAIYKNFFTQQPPLSPPIPGGCAVLNVVANMHSGFPGMCHTGAARAGVVNLTKSLAVEWAREGVRVNALAPGVIASSGLERYDAGMREMIASSAAGNIYASRLGTEAECAAGILFLLSPGAAFVTGACLNLDGGESLYAPLMPPVSHERNRAWDDMEGQANRPSFLQQMGTTTAIAAPPAAPTETKPATATMQASTGSPTPYTRASTAIVSKL